MIWLCCLTLLLLFDIVGQSHGLEAKDDGGAESEPARRNLQADFPTKNPPAGLYCEVGKGMTRKIDDMLDKTQQGGHRDAALSSGEDSVSVDQTNIMYCKGAQYCFR